MIYTISDFPLLSLTDATRNDLVERILETRVRFEDLFGFLLAALKFCTGPVSSRSVDVSVSCRCLLVEFPSPPESWLLLAPPASTSQWRMESVEAVDT